MQVEKRGHNTQGNLFIVYDKKSAVILKDSTPGYLSKAHLTVLARFPVAGLELTAVRASVGYSALESFRLRAPVEGYNY